MRHVHSFIGRRVAAFVVCAVVALMVSAGFSGVRADPAVDNAVQLDPFDPVPEIQFRHYGDNPCYDHCERYRDCDEGCRARCKDHCGNNDCRDRDHCDRDCRDGERCGHYGHDCRDQDRCTQDCREKDVCSQDCRDGDACGYDRRDCRDKNRCSDVCRDPCDSAHERRAPCERDCDAPPPCKDRFEPGDRFDGQADRFDSMANHYESDACWYDHKYRHDEWSERCRRDRCDHDQRDCRDGDNSDRHVDRKDDHGGSHDDGGNRTQNRDDDHGDHDGRDDGQDRAGH